MTLHIVQFDFERKSDCLISNIKKFSYAANTLKKNEYALDQ